MAPNWKTRRLGEIAEFVDSLHRTPTYTSTGVPMIRVKDIVGGPIRLTSAARVPTAVFEDFSRKRVPRPGDILFSRVGSYGRFGYLSEAVDCCLGQNTALLIASEEWRYLYYALTSPFVVRQVEALVVGAVQKTISLKSMKLLEVPLPTPADQRRIAAVLGALDDKIELNRRMNETLEGMARALFKSWFVDFDPVRAKMEGRAPYGMDADTAALFPDHFEDSELGKVPAGWAVETLGENISVLETGKRPRGGVKGITEGVPSVGAESIIGVGQFDYSKTKYVPREFFDGMKRGHIESRDVLIYKDGGRPGQLIPHVSMFGDGFPFEDFCINEHVYRVRGAGPVAQNYLYFALSSDDTMHEMAIKGTGVAVPGLNSKAVKSLTLLKPSEGILGAFDVLVESLVARILLNSKESLILAQLRDTLLPKLLSGELRVPEAEELVEDA